MAASTIRTIGVKFDPAPTERGVRRARRSLRTLSSTHQENTSRIARESGRQSNSIVRAFSNVRNAITAAFDTRAAKAFFATARAGIDSLGRGLNRLKNFLTHPITIAATGLGAVFGTKASIDAAGDLFKVGVTLKAVSKDAAGEMAFLRKTADRLGLSIIDNAQAYGKFVAAGGQAGLTATTLKEIFLGVSEAGAVFGLTAAEQQGALKALEQMLSKGNVQAEELRGQLGERIPGAFTLAAKAMGVTTEELNKMLDNGEVLAKDLLPSLGMELRKLAAPQLEGSLHTFGKETQRFKNAFFESQAQFGKPVADALAPIMRDATATLQQRVGEGDFERFGIAVGKGIQFAVEAVKQLKALVAPLLGIFLELGKLVWSAAKGFAQWAVEFRLIDALKTLWAGLVFVAEGLLNAINAVGDHIRKNFNEAQIAVFAAALGGLVALFIGNGSAAIAFATIMNTIVFAMELLISLAKVFSLKWGLGIAAVAGGAFVFRDAIGSVISFVKDAIDEVRNFASIFGVWDDLRAIVNHVTASVENVIEAFTGVRLGGVSAVEAVGAAVAFLLVMLTKAIRFKAALMEAFTKGGLEALKLLVKGIAGAFEAILSGIDKLVAGIDKLARVMHKVANPIDTIKEKGSAVGKSLMDFWDGLRGVDKTQRDVATSAGELSGSFSEIGTAGRASAEDINQGLAANNQGAKSLSEVWTDLAKATKKSFGDALASVKTAEGGMEGAGKTGKGAMEDIAKAARGATGDMSGLTRALNEFIRAASGIDASAFRQDLNLAAAFTDTGEGIADTAMAREAFGIKDLPPAIREVPTPTGGPGKKKKEKERKGRGRNFTKAQLRPLEDIAREEFLFEDFIDNLGRIEEAMGGAFNPEIMLEARREMDLLHEVMMEKVLGGTVSIEEAFRFGLIDAVNQLGTESAQAFRMAQDAFHILGDGIATGISAMLDGTKTLKQGFKDLAKSILDDISAMIIRMLVFQALQKATGLIFGTGGGTPIVSAKPVGDYRQGFNATSNGLNFSTIRGVPVGANTGGGGSVAAGGGGGGGGSLSYGGGGGSGLTLPSSDSIGLDTTLLGGGRSGAGSGSGLAEINLDNLHNAYFSSFAVGRMGTGAGVMQDVSRGLRPGQKPAILDHNEMVLRPQDLETLGIGQGQAGGNRNVTLTVNNDIKIESGGGGRPGTQQGGQDLDVEDLAQQISAITRQEINVMLTSPGHPLYEATT